MAARDKYSYSIECPKCKNSGVIHVSEVNYIHMRNPRRAVERVEGDFSVSVKGGLEVSVLCRCCSTKFKP